MNLSLSDAHDPGAALVDYLTSAAISDNKWHPVEHPKGAQLVMPGQKIDQVFVLDRGLIKLSYQTADGAEWIKSFIADEGVFGAADNELAPASSAFLAACLEPSRVAALPLRWVASRLGEDPGLREKYGRFLVWLQMRKQAREEALLCQSAAERYREFTASRPDLAVRLSQADIARYIGVTPIAFSRIKRRLARR